MRFAPGTQDSITNAPYFVLSECKRYTVEIPLAEGRPYLAWRASIPMPELRKTIPAVFLGTHPDAKAAKAACEAHAGPES